MYGAAIAGIFIGFVIVLQYKLRKDKKKPSERDAYLERESLASQTRKKSLDDLHYYKVHLVAMQIPSGASRHVQHLWQEIRSISGLPMASFDGKDNTDLKMEYGVANLNTLIIYESTYQNLMHHLYDISEALYEEGFIKEAHLPLKEALRLDCNISKHYFLLATLLDELKEYDALEKLLEQVQQMEIHKKEKLIKSIKFNLYNS